MKTTRTVKKKPSAAKKTLHRERDLIARIMETSPAGITMVDRKGKITFANHQAEIILGLTKDKISQRTYNDPKWHITDFEGNPFPEEKLPFNRVMRTGKPVHNVRHAIEHSDGKRVFISINATPLFDESKHVAGMVASLEDISEQVKAEAAVRESEEKLHRLSDITVEGIVIHEKGVILEANKPLVAMFGYNLSEVIGQNAFKFFTPESGKVMMQNIMSNYEKPYEVLGIKKNGTIFPVEVIGKTTTYLGRKVRIVSAQDITDRKRIEGSLRSSEERFRSIYENSTIGIYRTTPEGKILLANPALVKMLGYSSFEELSLRNLEKEGYEPTYSRSQFLELIESNGEVKGLESAWIRNDGTTIYVRESALAIRDKQGTTLYYDGTVENITERKRAEEALRESEASLKFSQQVAHLGHWTWDTIKNQVTWSDEMHRIFGLGPEEFTGNLDEIIMQTVHPDDREKVIKANNAVLTEQRPAPLEYRVVWPDQSVHTIFAVPGADITDANGKILKLTGIVHDITDLKRAEDAIRESEAKYRTIVDNINDALYIHDFHGTILDVNENACKMLGYTREELVGANLSKIDSAENTKHLPERMDRLLNEGWIVFEGQHVRKDGSFVPFEASAKLVTREGKGMIQGFARDITERKRAENAIKQATIEWQTTFDATSDAICLLDQNQKVQRTNKAMSELFPSFSGQMVGRHCWEIVHGTSKPIEECPILRMMNTYQRESMELQKEDKWFEVTVDPILDSAGKLLGAIHIVRDITERKRVEETLKTSEEQYRSIVETTSEWIWEIDIHGKHTFSNQTIESILGYTIAEFLGIEAFNLMHPEDREIAKNKFPKLIDSKQGWKNWIIRWYHKNGTIRYLESNANPIFDAKGDLLGYRGADRDITSRKKAEDSLRNSEEKFRSLAESISDWIWEVDTNGRYTYANPKVRDILGYEPEEIIGRTPFELMKPDEAEQISRQFKDAVSLHQPFSNIENINIHKDGHEVVLESSGLPIFDVENKLIGYRGIDRDITERKRVENLIRTQRDLAMSLSSVTDLNTGLSLLLEAALRLSGMDCGGIYIVDEPTGALDLLAHRGLSTQFIQSTTHYEANSPSVHLVMQGKSIYTTHTQLGTPLNETRLQENLRALAIIPMHHESKVIGCLNIASHTIADVPIFAREALETIASQIGSTIARLKVRKALEESEKKYRTVVDNIQDVFFRSDKEGRLIMSSPTGAKMLGYSSIEEILNKPLVMFMQNPEERELLLSKIRENGSINDYEVTLVKKDGTPLTASFTAHFYYNEAGKIQGTEGIIRDITERKQAEELLRVRMQLMEYAATHSLGELLQKALDEAGILTNSPIGFYHFVEADQKTLSLQAWSTRTIKEFCTATGKGMHYNIDEAGVWVDCVRQRKPVIHNDYESLPHRKGMPEGHAKVVRELVVPIQRGGLLVAILGVGNKTTDYTEKDIGLISYLADVAWEITERKRAEESLRESEEKFRSLAEQSPNMIFIHKKGKVVYANAKCEELMGYTKEEFYAPDFDFMKIIAPEYVEKLKDYYEKHLRGEDVMAYEYALLTKHEKRIDAIITTKLIPYENEKAILGIITDITDRIRAEEEKEKLQDQLLQSQKMDAIGQLAGGIAHDFNNMIGVILGYAALIEKQMDSSSPLYPKIKAITTAAERSANLTAQLLGFARKQIANPIVLNLNDELSTLQKMLHRLIGEDIDLKIMPGKDLWNIKVDPVQIDQILTNLATNARDAIENVGTISIETSNITFDASFSERNPEIVPGEYVMLTFSDTGKGIEQSTQDRIFEPFFTTKPKGQGTGLGLATVFGIIKQNNGYINVYSEPDKGTTFKVYFPRFYGEADTPLSPQEEISLVGVETILIVEDEEQLLALAITSLKTYGYTVLGAKSPQEAISICRQTDKKIDLLVTDVIMPEMNGKELKAQLIALMPDLKVIFMSGYTADIVATRGILEEGVEFLQKPFKPRILAKKVREVLTK